MANNIVEDLAQFGDMPSPIDRVSAIAQRQQIAQQEEQVRAARTRSSENAVREARKAARIRELQSQQWVPGGDIGRDIVGGATRGVGMVAEGLGEASGAVIDNPISRGLDKLGEAVTQSGQNVLDARSLATQNQIANSQITGNIFTGEDLSMGENFSLSGLFHQVLPSIAEMAPQIATMPVGGAPGLVAGIATGAAQAGISQGNQAYETVMGKSHSELMEFSGAYRALLEKNPNMNPAEAKIIVAEDNKKATGTTAAVVGGAGGAFGRWLWNGAPLTTGEAAANAAAKAAGKAVPKVTDKAVDTASTKYLAGTLGKRAAGGFVEEAAEENLEDGAATVASNLAIDAKQEVGGNSLASTVLGGLSGTTVNTAGAIPQAIRDRSESALIKEVKANQLDEEQTREQVDEVSQAIDDGKLEDVLNDQDYNRDIIAGELVRRATDKDSTPTQRKAADEGLAKLDVQARSTEMMLESIKEKGVEGHFAQGKAVAQQTIDQLKAIRDAGNVPEEQETQFRQVLAQAEGQLQSLENREEQMDSLTPAQIDGQLRVAKATIKKIEDGAQSTRQAVRDSAPDDTAELVQTAANTEAAPEARTAAAEQVVDRAITDPDRVTDDDLQQVIDSDFDLAPDTREVAQMTLDLRADAASNPNLQEIRNDPTKLDKNLGYASLDKYYARVERALTAKNPGAASRIVESVDKYARQKRSKAAAALEAFNLVAGTNKQYAIRPSKDPETGETTWSVEEHKIAGKAFAVVDKVLQDAKGLSFSKGSANLAQNIAREADFIEQHAQVLRYQVGKNQPFGNGQTTDVSQFTDSFAPTVPPEASTPAATPASTSTTPTPATTTDEQNAAWAGSVQDDDFETGFNFPEGTAATAVATPPNQTPVPPRPVSGQQLSQAEQQVQIIEAKIAALPADSPRLEGLRRNLAKAKARVSGTTAPSSSATPATQSSGSGSSSAAGQVAIIEALIAKEPANSKRLPGLRKNLAKAKAKAGQATATPPSASQASTTPATPVSSASKAQQQVDIIEAKIAALPANSPRLEGLQRNLAKAQERVAAESGTPPVKTPVVETPPVETPATPTAETPKPKTPETKTPKPKTPDDEFHALHAERDRIYKELEAMLLDGNTTLAERKAKLRELNQETKRIKPESVKLRPKHDPSVHGEIHKTFQSFMDDVNFYGFNDLEIVPPRDENTPAETPTTPPVETPSEPSVDDLDSAELKSAETAAYDELGKMQRAKAEGEKVDRGEMLVVQKRVKAITDKVLAGDENAPVRELVDMLNKPSGATVANVAQWAYENTTGDMQVVLDLLQDTDSFTNRVSGFSFGDLGDSNQAKRDSFTGGYHNKKHYVALRPKLIPTEPSANLADRFAHTVVHELMHPVLNRAMVEDMAFRDEVKRVREVARAWYAVPENAALVNGRDGEADYDFNALEEKGRVAKLLEYALADYDRYDDPEFPLELITTVMTHPEVQALFSQIQDPESPERSILQALKEAIIAQLRKLLGDPNFDRTLLESVTGLTEQAIKADTTVQGDSDGNNGTNGDTDTGDSNASSDDNDSATDPADPPTPPVEATGVAENDTAGTAENTAVKSPVDPDFETEKLERFLAADAVKSGEAILYGYENDNDPDADYSGPLRESEAGTVNLIQAHMPSGHRTAMSQIDGFIPNMLLDPRYQLEDFSQYLSEPDRIISTFRKKGSPGNYRNVLNFYHSQWVDMLHKQIRPTKGKFRLLDPISYLFTDNKLDDNAASALAMAAFNYIGEKGNTLYNNRDEDGVRSVFGLDDEADMPVEMFRLGLTIGSREDTVRRDMGKLAVELMDLQIKKGTPENELEMLYSSFGTHALVLAMRAGIYERNIYNGLQVRPEGAALLRLLNSKNQAPDETTLKNRNELQRHLATTDLTPSQRAEFMSLAFQRHVFVRNYRTTASDIQPLMTRLHKEGLYNGERLTYQGISKIAEQSQSLNVLEKARLKQSFTTWQNKKTRNSIPPLGLSAISSAHEGSREFLDELYGLSKNNRLPVTDVKQAGFSEKFKNRSSIPVPRELVKMLNRAAKVPRTLTQGLLSVDEKNPGILTRLRDVDDDFMPLLQGMVPDEGAWRHADDQESIDARNEALRREARTAFEHIDNVLGGDPTMPFYKRYKVSSNDRIIEDSDGFNGQAYRMHRALESNADWVITVDPSKKDNAAHVAFKVAAAQGFGVGVDKMDQKTALKAFDKQMESAAVQEALGLMDQMRQDPSYVWSESERARMIELVNDKVEPAEGMQYFRALLEVAKYKEAKRTGKPFQSDLSAEIDGRASGATITIMQMGLTSDYAEMDMELGGMIPLSSNHDNAGSSIQESQNDIYKEIVIQAVANMDAREAELAEAAELEDGGNWSRNRKMEKSRFQQQQLIRQRALIRRVLGPLTTGNDDSPMLRMASSMARQVVKEPVTANVFGAGKRTLQNTMSDEFYQYFKDKLVKYARDHEVAQKAGDAQEMARIQQMADYLVGELNGLMPYQMAKIPRQANADYTGVLLNAAQRGVMDNAIVYSIAQATTQAIETRFAHTRHVAKSMQEGMLMAQNMYKLAYETEKRKTLLEQSKAIAESGDKIFQPVHRHTEGKKRIYQPGLTKYQHEAIVEKLKPIEPLFHTASSQSSGDYTQGATAFQSGIRDADEVDAITGQSEENGGVLYSGIRGRAYLKESFTPFATHGRAPIKSTSFKGRQIDTNVIGIGGLAKGAHNQDARVAHQIMAFYGLINAHDGFTAGFASQGAMGQKANEFFLNTLSEYSSPERIAEMVMRVVDAFEEYKNDNVHDDLFFAQLESVLPTIHGEGRNAPRVPVDESPVEVAQILVNKAAQASRARLFGLARLKAVDQYYMPGSALQLTDEQREAFRMRAELSDFERDIVNSRAEGADPFSTSDDDVGAAKTAWLNKGRGDSKTPETGSGQIKVPTILQEDDAPSTVPYNGRKTTVSVLNSINKALRASSGKAVTPEVLAAAIKDPARQAFVYGQLVDPASKVMDLVKGNQLEALRKWHEKYHSRQPNITDTAEDFDNMPTPHGGPLTYSTHAVFDALDKQSLPADEASYLKKLLDNITGNLFDQGGAAKRLTYADMGQSIDELVALQTSENMGPFASNLYQAGVQLERSQAFVAEQIELTMQGALASQTMADNGVAKLYGHAKRAMQADGRDFYLGPDGKRASDAQWQAATDLEKAQAKQTYDLIFSTKGNAPLLKSDHLSRFVALGLTYPPLRQQLDQIQAPAQKIMADEPMGTRLERLFNNLLTSIGNLLTGVSERDSSVTQLEKLARKLAMNEHKRRLAFNAERNKSVDFIDTHAAKLTGKMAEGVAKFGDSDLFQKSKYPEVRFVGKVTNAVAEDRIDQVMSILEEWREHERRNVREGFLGSILSELRGEKPETRKFFDLLGLSKKIEQTRKEKKDIIQDEILTRFSDSDNMTEQQKAAVTQLYLRSDLASLIDRGYEIADVHNMVRNEAARKAKISDLQDQLLTREQGKALVADTTEMAYEMATGRVVSEFGYQNAAMLVYGEMGGIPHDTTDEIIAQVKSEQAEVTGLVDELGSLLALDMAPYKHHAALKPVLATESARGDEDALRYVLGMHRKALQQSREALFDNRALTTIKGYVRESYDPYNTYEVADKQRGAELLALGYTYYGSLQDSNLAASNTTQGQLPSNATGVIDRGQKNEPALYVLKGVGLSDYQTAAMTNDQQNARGTVDNTAFEFLARNNRTTYKSRAQTAKHMADRRRAAKAARIAKLNVKSYRPSVRQATHEMPVFDQSGEVNGFRYKASHQTRDQAMGRDNRIEAVLGQTIGSTYSKVEGKKQNLKVVETLKEFYDASESKDEDRFVELSPTAPDERMRETYKMLPDHTKKAIRDHWGGNKMMVRKDLVDITFGYRTLTTDVVINKAKHAIDKMLGKELGQDLLRGKRQIQVRRAHDITADIMRRYKDFIVVRNFTTLYGNMKSNAMLLFMYGVPLTDIVRSHRRAFQGLRQHQKDHKQLLRLQASIDAALPGSDTTAMELEALDLEHGIRRNPVKPLIDQGMFQTIMDDVDLDRENTRFQTSSERFVDKYSSKLPGIVQRAGKEAFVAQDTFTYKMLSQGTQMSDFIARFVLYEHLKDKQAKASASERESDAAIMSTLRQAFVNYNRPTDQRLQYMNDIGLVRFTKYTLGTQKIIFDRMRHAPSRSMAAYMLDRHVDGVDTILSSNILGNIGNPLHVGPLDAHSVLDEPLWIKMALGFL